MGVAPAGLDRTPRLYPVLTHWANEFRPRGGLGLIDALPVPSIGGPIDGTNSDAVVGRVATRIAADDDAVARLKRVFLNSLTAELPGGAPLGGPRDGLIFLAGSFQKNRGMRIAEQELDDCAFYDDGLGRVGAREGVVRMGVTRTQEGSSQQEGPEREFGTLPHSWR